MKTIYLNFRTDKSFTKKMMKHKHKMEDELDLRLTWEEYIKLLFRMNA